MNRNTFFSFSFFILLGFQLIAQEDIIRIGVLQLPYQSINIGYEHPFNPNFSLNLTTNVQLPLSFDSGLQGNIIRDLNANWEVGEFRDGVEWNGFDITPEARFYPNGARGRRARAPRGFFFSILARYSQYNWTLPYTWIDNNSITFSYDGTEYTLPPNSVQADINTEAKTHAISGGIGIGNQWIVNRARTLAIGVDFALGWGGAWGDGTMVVLTESVQIADQNLQERLGADGIDALVAQYGQDIVQEVEEGLNEGDFPLSGLFRIDLESERNVVTATGNIPWILIRLGFTVGYAF
ncbi:MAG: DUF3575 domain-containing protein [Bacteroidota bacterium]